MSDKNDFYNSGGKLAFISSMVFVFAFFIYLVALHPGVDLGENLQAKARIGTKLAEASFDASKVAEPWKATDEMAAYGKKVFSQNCAICHGEKGMGDGAAGAGLNPKPRNLVKGPWKIGGGSIGLFKAITEGLPGTSMAAFGHIQLNDRWAIVHFISSITEVKPQEDPAKVADFGKTAK